MDIDRVRYFNVFAETGSLVRASEVLHISQPALSKALRLLEKEVGLRLIEAEGRGLTLTDAGKQFVEETKPCLAQWLGIARKIRERENWRPSRIASFEVFTTYFLGHLLKHLDLTGLEVHEFGPGKMEQAIAERKVDLAITYLPVPRSGIEFVEVNRIKMGVFGLETFKSEKFSDLPFVVPILPAEGTPSKMVGLDGWPDHVIDRKVKYQVTMMESAMELCREGHSVAYLPEFIVNLHNRRMLSEYRLKELRCSISAEDRKQGIFLVRRQGAVETLLERKIAQRLRTLK